ncbi:unnamed protein product [Discula destructiva]
MSLKPVFSVVAMAAMVILPVIAQVTNAMPSEVPANISNKFTAWAQFCDDTDCSVDCGEWIDMTNSGCVNERGRQSIHVKTNGPNPMVGLVYSPGQDCNCQTECDDFDSAFPDCWHLNTTRSAESLSYRFIGWGSYDGAGGQCDGSEVETPSNYFCKVS